MAGTPELVAPGVYRIDGFRVPKAINVYLLENDDGWTLVDTGLASSVERIEEALSALGSGPDDIKRVFLTHQHDDHIGGLPGIVEIAPHAEIGAPVHEAEVISGERGYDPSSNRAMRYLARNAKPPGIPVGKVLREGDFVSGFRIISTPGHTLGHVSLLRDEDGLLFTADAFARIPRRVRIGVVKSFCTDPAMAKRSAAKLLDEDFATVAFGHGAVLRSGAREKLSKAITRFRP